MELETLMQNEEFSARMESCGTVEEAAAILREYGLEVTTDELLAVLSAETGDELDESDLEQVAGGIIMPWRPRFPKRPTRPFPRWPWIPLIL